MYLPIAIPLRRSVLVCSILCICSIPALAEEPPKKDDRPAKEKLLRSGTGPSREEAAISRGLAWLARQQRDDGSWEFDAPNARDQSYQVAATGLAILPFLEIGEGPTKALKYQTIVRKGIDWLASWDKGFIAKNMYAQAIATLALCDAYRLSNDDRLKVKATAAVDYIVKAQAKNGSWGYRAGSEGDTTILGWQILALVAADRAGIRFDKDKVYSSAIKFLKSVSDGGGATYGYRERGKSHTTTAVGLASLLGMGHMTPKDDAVVRGAKHLMGWPPEGRMFDPYHWYFATQVFHHTGGEDRRVWNSKVRELLTDTQDISRDDSTYGSWRKDDAFVGKVCGRLGTTCFALLTLEVAYRKPELKVVEK